MHIFLLHLLMTMLVANNQENPLKSLQWKNRVVIIYSNQSNDVDYQNQFALLKEQEEELVERDVIVLSVFEEGRKAGGASLAKGWGKPIYEQYFSSDNNFQLILIGKDGGLKFKNSQITNIQELIEVIDRMPMRKAEMKKNRK